MSAGWSKKNREAGSWRRVLRARMKLNGCAASLKRARSTDLFVAGEFAETDSCCRIHDHCPHVIHAFSSNYGHTNFNLTLYAIKKMVSLPEESQRHIFQGSWSGVLQRDRCALL
uniref:Phospholipase A2-like central domain-containing protein n=1 Tax=Sander lucioperca TaxID=283035 RepID=A0A8C9XSG2_SANLU